MKKIIAIVSTLSVLASASAFAKTEGNYIGFDLHRASVDAIDNNLSQAADPRYVHRETSKTGVGLSYKHAFNLGNNIFIAPGAFYERIGIKQYYSPNNGTDENRLSIKNRYGIRADIGYDINDNLAVYATAGVSRTGYKIALGDAHTGTLENDKSKLAMLYGVGFTSKVNEDLTLGFEFNTQRFSVKQHDQSSDIRTKIVLDVYKVTLGYHF